MTVQAAEEFTHSISTSEPGLWARMATPLATTGVVLAGVGYFAASDPHEPGLFPPCLLLTTTGLDCPTCGGSRAFHDLSRGNLGEAFDHNALVVLMIPLVVLGLVAWFWRRARNKAFVRNVTRNKIIIGTSVLLGLFLIIRNLPGFEYLDSGVF